MKSYQKISISKYIITFSCAFLCMAVASHLYSREFLENTKVLFFCAPVYHIAVRGCMVLFLIALQNYHADHIMYFFHGKDFLAPRYGCKQNFFRTLFCRILSGNIHFILLSFMGYVSCALLLQMSFSTISPTDVLLIFIRVYGLCCIYTFIQVLFLIYFDEQKSFAFLAVFAAALTFFSGEPLQFVAEIWTRTLCWILISSIGLWLTLHILHKKLAKEWGQYAN